MGRGGEAKLIMFRGIYAAASGMVANEMRHSVIANNLANASTAGFKRNDGVFEGFYQAYLGRDLHPHLFDVQPGPGGGVRMQQSFTDLQGGPVKTTGDSLNLALSGPGYLAVDTPQGERFTRNGQLALNELGQLVTTEGHPLQGDTGEPITVDGVGFEVDAQGGVHVGGALADQLRVVEFETPRALQREGNSLYAAPEDAQFAPAVDTRVLHKSLEMSNVQVPNEMVNMLAGLRAYGANQQVISTFDQTTSRVIEQVGMPV